MSSFRSPRRIFINAIRNLSYLVSLQAGPFFSFDLISLLLGFLVDFAPRHFRSTNGKTKSHKFKSVDNFGIPFHHSSGYVSGQAESICNFSIFHLTFCYCSLFLYIELNILLLQLHDFYHYHFEFLPHYKH